MPRHERLRVWKLLLHRVIRMGRVRAVLCITLAAEVMSVSLDWVLLRISPFPEETYRASLTMAWIIPLLVAPVIGGVIVSLLLQLEEVRTELEKTASRDGLTTLFNRTCFMEMAQREISRANRYQLPLALLLFDVDDFKRVNDRYGHAVGDLVLAAIARTCMALVREFDVMARYGGEEFVLLLPRTDEEGALEAAEKLRMAIAEVRVKAPKSEQEIGVTVSVGGAILRKAETAETLFVRSDEEMYRAKLAGKNCCRLQ